MDVYTCDIGTFTIWCRQFTQWFTRLDFNTDLFVSTIKIKSITSQYYKCIFKVLGEFIVHVFVVSYHMNVYSLSLSLSLSPSPPSQQQTNSLRVSDYDPSRIYCDRPATRPGVYTAELSTDTAMNEVSGAVYVVDEYQLYIQLFNYRPAGCTSKFYFIISCSLPRVLVLDFCPPPPPTPPHPPLQKET